LNDFAENAVHGLIPRLFGILIFYRKNIEGARLEFLFGHAKNKMNKIN